MVLDQIIRVPQKPEDKMLGLREEGVRLPGLGGSWEPTTASWCDSCDQHFITVKIPQKNS